MANNPANNKMFSFDITPDQLLSRVHSAIASTTTTWEAVARIRPSEATFQSAIDPILHDENASLTTLRFIAFFESVSPSKELRDASHDGEQLLSQHAIALYQREDIFAVVDAVKQKNEPLDDQDRIFLNDLHSDFLRAGIGAVQDEADKKRLKELLPKIRELGREYIRNLDSDLGGQWFTEEQLDGVPEARIAAWKSEEGKRFVNHKVPNIVAVMNSATNAETRHKLWFSFENRMQDRNPQVLREMVTLRDEAARLQGFKHFAELRERDRILTTDQALSFLKSMRAALKVPTENQTRILRDLKAKDSSEEFQLWDRQFYQTRAQNLVRAMSDELAAEYFPLDNCLQRMMSLLGLMFGVEYESVEGASTWHEDVRVYRVWNRDENEELLGYYYLDMFPRDFKYGHKGNYNLSRGFIHPDGSRHHPAAVLVTNCPAPTPTTPSLLKYPDVVSIFHELGHGLHSLTSKTRAARLHGTATPRDFVEIPSIMLEHIFWTKPIVRFISGHYKTEEKLPDDAIDKLIASRFNMLALHQAHNLLLAMFDLHIHTPKNPKDLENMDFGRVFNKLRDELYCIKGPEDSSTYCRWRFPVGYATVYYTYLLSGAFSYDIFETKFRPLMPSSEIHAKSAQDLVSDALRDEFRRYRHQVLQPGGCTDSHFGLLQAFLGKEPSADAYLAALQAGN